MKKIQKSKKGFTLIEMVLVIAIIVILAAVMLIGIGTYIQNAQSAAAKMSEHNVSIQDLSQQIEDLLT